MTLTLVLLIGLSVAALVVLAGLRISYNVRVLSYLTLVLIFFPIHLKFMGNDAVTTGTIAVLFLYACHMLESAKSGAALRDRFDIGVYLLIVSGFLSLILPLYSGLLRNDEVGPAVRQYVGFFGAMLFFLVIRNHGEQKESRRDYVERLLSLFIVMTMLHILISIGIKYVPPLELAFKPFYTREHEFLGFVPEGGEGIVRVSTFVFTPETYGEFLAVLGPIVVYKIVTSRNSLWMLCLLASALGLIFSATRSGIILFAAGIVVSVLYHARRNLPSVGLLLIVLATVSAAVMRFLPSILDDVAWRFADASQAYRSSGSLLETTNRGFLVDVWPLVMSQLRIFGHGVADFRFHNLFLTTLHRMGVVSATLFFAVLLYPLAKLTRSLGSGGADKALAFSCLLSLALFFVNEFKFEFTRHDSYQQICWGLFAVYSLVPGVEPRRRT